jgi:hypothetical protein
MALLYGIGIWCFLGMANGERKYPPAYYRYREKHPAVTIRVTKDLKGLLDSYRMSLGNLSYGKAVKKLLEEKADLMRLKAELDEAKKRSYEDGFVAALQMFIFNPYGFYDRLIERAQAQGLKHFEPALFTAPCCVCKEPMIITHRDSNWLREERPILLEAFKKWRHVRCGKHK